MTAATYTRTAGGSALDGDAAAVPVPFSPPRRVIAPIRSNMPHDTRASISLLVILRPHHRLAREIGAARSPDNGVLIHGRPHDGFFFFFASGPHDRLYFPGRPHNRVVVSGAQPCSAARGERPRFLTIGATAQRPPDDIWRIGSAPSRGRTQSIRARGTPTRPTTVGVTV